MIGILGGTFDPIHFGHLRMAEELSEALDLSEVRFIPAGTPPHKNTPVTPAKHRAEMVRLAITDNSKFNLDERELDRANLPYTVDTLASLRRELGQDVPLCLLMGSDAFLGLPTWHRWNELLMLCHIVVAERPKAALQPETMPSALQTLWTKCVTTQINDLPKKPAGSIFVQSITPLEISSTQIRKSFKCGQTPRYLTPKIVIDYIAENHLFASAA